MGNVIKAAPCPLCGVGDIGFRICAGGERLVLVCDGCGYLWLHPSRLEAQDACDLLSVDFRRSHPDIDLRPSRWATRQEIEAYGWGCYLLTPGDFL